MHVRRLLGEILVADYHVLESDVAGALVAQSHGLSDRLGQILVRRGVVTDRDLVTALGRQLGVPVVLRLAARSITSDLLALIPAPCAERNLVIPVALSGRGASARLVVAMVDPTDDVVLRDLRVLSGLHIERAIATEDDVRRAFKVFYLGGTSHADLGDMTDALEAVRSRLRVRGDATQDPPVTRVSAGPGTGASV